MALPNKDPKASPESSLGEVGKALLKFFKPLLQVKAHNRSIDPIGEALENANSSAAQSEQALRTARGIESDKVTASGVAVIPPKPGERGSGFIDVKRSPGTLWIDVVEDLVDDCQNSSGAAKVRLGNSAYQTAVNQAVGLSAKTVGRILDVVTLVRESVAEEEEKAAAKEARENKAVKSRKAA